MPKKTTRITKKKLKEVQEQVNKQNRRVRRDNAWFASLKPAEKRVAIARDVLSQLRLGKLVATPGVWLRDGGEEPLICAEDSVEKKNVELQAILNKQEQCTGCALGGMFMCAVKRANKLKVKDLTDFTSEDGYEESVDVDGSDATAYLGRWFDQEQLSMIESAFERGDGAFGSEAANFCADEEDAGERMRLIMENIIVHKGRFNPDVQPIATFKTPGFDEVLSW